MPQVSVVVPIYKSKATLARCLQSLSEQTFLDREVILVDSSPGPECEEIAKGAFPDLVYRKSATRLSADEARNVGVQLARGELLVFTDPDAYPRPDWLETLVRCHRDNRCCVIGAVACYGEKWFDRAAHLVKFDKWLPSGKARLVTEGPTVNFLVPRDLYLAFGPFPETAGHGDTELSWRLTRGDVRLLFTPAAVVEHHHLQSWSELLAERFVRGAGYAELVSRWEGRSRLRLAARFLVSLLPFRLGSQLNRLWKNSRASGQHVAFLLALPVVVTALQAGLLGECAYCVRALTSHR
jgi:GT2 family glycosyltransferase